MPNGCGLAVGFRLPLAAGRIFGVARFSLMLSFSSVFLILSDDVLIGAARGDFWLHGGMPRVIECGSTNLGSSA
jgi:hypothetical protein